MTMLWMRFPATIALLLVSLAFPAPGWGQWLKQPTAGIPRTVDGKPDLAAPPPRNSDGKPDLSGLWQAGAFTTDFKPGDARDWAQAEFRQREQDVTAESWSTLCLPAGPMVNLTGLFKIMQTRENTAILYEATNNYRQIFTDGRLLPNDPNPTWQGYSVGHWDGETFVVETTGFNDRSRIGRPAYAHSEALRVTERYRRRDFGHIDLQMIVDDPKTFVRPWSMNIELVLAPDTEMLEYVCNENEKDRQHFVRSESIETRHADQDVTRLARFVGTYEVPGPRGRLMTVRITLDGSQLAAEVPERGYAILVPQSATSFLYRGAVLEFLLNEQGDATHLVAHVVEGDFKGPRINAP